MSKSIEEGKLISIADFKARRNFLRLSAVVGTSFLFSSCSGPTRPVGNSPVATITPAESNNDEDQDNDDVGAVEDLMREHGVLRRALLVYDASARKLRSKPADLSPDALQNTAKLFRAFGEDYHETKLEEAFIFPAVKKTEGSAADLVDILLVQHQRGREITDYILATTQGTKFTAANSEQLAKALDSFVLMYQHHTAREDTILFPAWKKTMTEGELDDMGDNFEDIERQQFGGDGFDDAVKQIGDIETEVGIADISQFTPPPMVKSNK
jgi:hemerythrin-like domain-containing protein